MSHEVIFQKRGYKVYSEQEAASLGIEVSADWRTAKAGEFVRTDTAYVLEVLANGTAGNSPWIRTACGTYSCRSNAPFTHHPRENRYSFGGNNEKYSVTRRVELFAKHYARTRNAESAYRYAFPRANYRQHIKVRSRKLLDIPAVKKIVDDELSLVLTECKIDRLFTVGETKDLYDLIKDTEDLEPPLDKDGKYLYPPKTMEARRLRFSILQWLDRIYKERLETKNPLSGSITEKKVYQVTGNAADALENSVGKGKIPSKHTITVKKKVEVNGDCNGICEGNISGGSSG